MVPHSVNSDGWREKRLWLVNLIRNNDFFVDHAGLSGGHESQRQRIGAVLCGKDARG